ncbi:MAG TPA: hypothetical protein VHN99_11055 [Deinococcales bacterium]|nr:hypothetical protein [Deinococcales bacterium]
MTPWEALLTLERLGGGVTLEGEHLRVRAATPLPLPLKAALVTGKADLLAHLRDSWAPAGGPPRWPGLPLPWPDVTLAPGLLYHFAGPGGTWTVKRDGNLYHWRRLRGVLEPGGLASGFLVTFSAWMIESYRREGEHEREPGRSAAGTAA